MFLCFAKSSVASPVLTCIYIFEHYSFGLLFSIFSSMTIIVSLSASLIGILDEDSLKLYTLIWRRTMACQMEASRTELVGYCLHFYLLFITPFFGMAGHYVHFYEAILSPVMFF